MLILASASPRRQELLKQITSQFSVVVSNVDEQIEESDIISRAQKIALKKGESVFQYHQDDIVLSCDTLVILNGKLLEKPRSDEEAREMLKSLSNKRHIVVTGYAIFDKTSIISGQEITYVTFNELSDELIDAYVATKSPLDKAGGYGIQDKEFNLVKEIEGSYYNVMGFPLERLKELLKSKL